ncbi:MAG TPA: hypothetical protein ENK52_00555 [Saprospiraceae bacterium]|nr:hypothetical protein [Saprospiraceae bacterium]
MRTIICLLFINLLWINNSSAQTEINETIKNVGDKLIEFDFERANVNLKTWDKNEILIKGFVSINVGENDDNFEIEIKESADKISIETFIKDFKNIPKVNVLHIGKHKGVFKRNSKGRAAMRAFKKKYRDEDCNFYSEGDGVDVDIELEIFVPKKSNLNSKSLYGSIKLTDVSASLEIENTYGSIETILANNNPNQTIDLHSTYSFVDLSIPESVKADINMKTGYGEIFTDVDIKREGKAPVQRSFGAKVKGTLNGGGVAVNLEANYQNIYLRKKTK